MLTNNGVMKHLECFKKMTKFLHNLH